MYHGWLNTYSSFYYILCFIRIRFEISIHCFIKNVCSKKLHNNICHDTKTGVCVWKVQSSNDDIIIYYVDCAYNIYYGK